MPNLAVQRINVLRQKPWLKRGLLGLGVFLLLFGAFGYFALPGIIKSQIEKIAAEKFHRQLSIERIDVNPYALSLDIYGVKLSEPDGKTLFVAFDHLYVNASAQSLFRLAPVVKEARLEKPFLHLVRNSANHYNIDDLIAPDEKPPGSQAPARFAAYNLQIEGGRIEFEDKPVHARHVVSDLKIGIPFVSSFPAYVDVFVEPLFSAKFNGAPLLLKGKARPFSAEKEAVVDLDLDAADLTRYVEYLPFQPRFKLPSAKLDVHLGVNFHQDKQGAAALALTGTVALKSLLVTELDGKPLLKLPQLLITLDNLNVLAPQLTIARVAIDHPEVEMVQGADGNFNLSHLLPAEANTRKKSQDATEKVTAGKSEKEPAATPSGLQITLAELAIQGARIHYRDGQRAHPMQGSVDNFDLLISKTEADFGKRSISVGAITSARADFTLLHDKAGVANASLPPHEEAATKQAALPGKREAPAYSVNVGRVGIGNWSARMEDRSLPQNNVTTVTAFTLDAQNLSTAAGKPGHLEVRMDVNQRGKLAVTGDVGLAPLHADLRLDMNSVDLMPLQPYVADRINLLVTRAALSTKASLKLDEGADGKLKGSFKGNAALGDLATVDKLSGNDFLRWKSLAFSGIDVQLAPLAVNIEQIAATDFFARIIIDPSGRINLQNISRKNSAEGKSLTEEEAGETPPPAATPAVAAEPPAADTPPVKIRKVKLQGGRVRFSDNFIKPNYTASLMDLNGSINDLSSDAASAASVDIHGKVNSAPLNINGRVNPLKGNLFLDVKADVKGMEMAPLSPYSGKYIGYEIEKGKLSFDVTYHLEDRKLEAQNRFVLNQFTLGNKVESPSAVSLPVQLALTLLSDRNGVIDINLPIGGSLDDPQFSVGSLIVKVIVNLISKAVTSPFALIGSMFGGGGEELSWLEFDPGRHAILQAGEEKLTALARALDDRPALRLEITGRYDPVADTEGLRRAGIDRKVRALKLKQLAGKGESVDSTTLTVSAEEYPGLLAKVYKDEDFPKPRNLIGLQKNLPVSEMEKLMLANAKVGDNDLVVLGNQRAQAVKDWLGKNGAVSPDRIFIVAAKPSDDKGKAKPSRADFSLR